MKIALFHYHLNAGGVTRVIENHLYSLDAVWGDRQAEVLIIVGEGNNALPAELKGSLKNINYRVVPLPRLSYDACLEPDVLADEVESILAEAEFLPGECILHIHNHALGKNVAWPQAVWHLAERGFHLFLQIHDFIEDFRPQNYHKSRAMYANASEEDFIKYLYPQAQHIHYSVLNKRDENILAEAGLDDARLHVLPNPVFGEIAERNHADAKAYWSEKMNIDVPDRLILYPVRGITRKNVGELLLHAAIAEPGTVYALTLPPMNPIEKAHYDKWEHFAEQYDLPCYFGVGTVDGLGFADNVAAADAILTTSVAEGFGMVFLEPWLMGRPVIGRDLAEITSDFKENNITYPGLYQRIDIPLDWVGEAAYVRQWSNTYVFALHSYGIDKPSAEELHSLAMRQVQNGAIDFALLTIDLQRQVLRAIIDDPKKQKFLREQLAPQMQLADSEMIEANAVLINKLYSFAYIGDQLAGCYTRVLAEQGAAGFATLNRPSAVLDGFLSSHRFYPLRVGE